METNSETRVGTEKAKIEGKKLKNAGARTVPGRYNANTK